MPAKRAPKVRPRASSTADSSNAPTTSRKRARSSATCATSNASTSTNDVAIVGAEAPLRSPSVSVSSGSNSVVAVPPPPVDVDAAAAVPESLQRTSPATRQATLPGSASPAPVAAAARRKTPRASGTAAGKQNDKGVHVREDDSGTPGGEVRPTAAHAPPARARAAPSLASSLLRGPTAAPLLEEALLRHIRHALGMFYVQASIRGIELAVQPDTGVAAARGPEAGDGAAPSSSASVSPSGRDFSEAEIGVDDVDELDAASAAAQVASSDDNSVVVRAAVPCVQYFILHECARVAHLVRCGKGGNLCVNTDPATSAFELLTFLLSMLNSTGGIAALFVLACPSCRASGLTEAHGDILARLLVLSRRVTDESELLAMDLQGMLKRLGLCDERRGKQQRSGAPSSTAQTPRQGVMSCCPFAEAHTSLHLLCLSRFFMKASKRADELQWRYVPLTAHAFTAIAAAAVQFERAEKAQVQLCARLRQQASQAAMRSATGARQQRGEQAKPPQLSAAVRALLATEPDGVTWAEALLHTAVPESAALLSHRDAVELQSRIRRVFAYTSGDSARGGYLTVTLPLTVGAPLHRLTRACVLGNELVHARTLFSLMSVGQHIADAVRRGGRCACRHTNSEAASVTSALFLETHVARMARLRRCREESYLLDPDNATQGQSTAAVFDVDADVAPAPSQGSAVAAPEAAAKGSGGGGAASTSFYSAGSMSRFLATMEMTKGMTPGEVVEHAARATLEEAEALAPSQVPQQYIQAELKRHQLENVQWMWRRECEGYGEFVSVPLYHVGLPEAAAPVVRQVAVMWYCAAVNCLYIEEAGNNGASAHRPAASRVRGGLLCDDVGLGKTLSVLTLCAYDRAARERGEAGADVGASASHEPAVGERNFWHVKDRSAGVHGVVPTYRPAVLRWAVGAPAALAMPHPVVPTPLPRTTLVVVPLSIATQWIEEIRKFYPTASYLLFHSAKRAQYTVADMRRADFVVTTYETLSTHLRQEADGERYWLGRSADAADDATCAAAASQGINGLLPGDVYEAVQWYASEVVWPETAQPMGSCLSEVELVSCRSHGSPAAFPADNSDATHPQPGERPPGEGTASSAWRMVVSRDGRETVVQCPCLTFSVTARTPDVAFLGSSERARLPRCYAVGAVSDAFLDRVWALLCDFLAHVDMPRSHQHDSFQATLFHFTDTRTTLLALAYLHDAAIAHCPSVADCRELTRRVLLPPLWHLLTRYWEAMKPHYDTVRAAAAGRPAFRLTDLRFHRIVLDESQKCGPASLFHLLNGERRWGVTGTVLNNKTESLAPVLHFLGLHAAARALDVKSSSRAAYSVVISRRHPQSYELASNGWFMASEMYTALRNLWWLGRTSQEPLNRLALMSPCCVCGQCMQVAIYGALCEADIRVPCELRMPPMYCTFAEDFNCTPNMLFEILARTMLRHERNQQVSRELQLPPVQHEVHLSPLSADEMHLYDRVARVIMSVAARLHRLGAFSSRIASALQWVQELCRLCLHPSRVGNAELVRGDAEARVLRGVRLLQDSDTSLNAPDIDAALAGTFVAASPQEALRWAEGIAAAALRPAVPEETTQTLAELAQVPPLLPQCGVCMDDMAAPTLLNCFHMFCKECVLGIIDASRSVSSNVNAKCPYCRDRKSLVAEKRVVEVDAGAAVAVEDGAAGAATGDPAHVPLSTDEEVEAALSRIGDGSRARAFVGLVEQIWHVQPDDGVLVFSRYPTLLQLTHDAVVARGYAPEMVSGSSTLAQRQRAMRAMLPTAADAAGSADLQRRRILFVASRSANAGLNLTFANHVVFLEPNLNPAMEQQAIGRVHRFGQLKQVVVHHLYAPHTIEEAIYRRSVRLRGHAASQGSQSPSHQPHAAVSAEGEPAQQRSLQFGRVEPSEVLQLLEYPVPPQ